MDRQTAEDEQRRFYERSEEKAWRISRRGTEHLAKWTKAWVRANGGAVSVGRDGFRSDARFRELCVLSEIAVQLALCYRLIARSMHDDAAWEFPLEQNPLVDERSQLLNPIDPLAAEPRLPWRTRHSHLGSIPIMLDIGCFFSWYGAYERGLRAIALALGFVNSARPRDVYESAGTLGRRIVDSGILGEHAADWGAHLDLATAIRDTVHHGGARKPDWAPFKCVYHGHELVLDPGKLFCTRWPYLFVTLLADAVQNWSRLIFCPRVEAHVGVLPEYVDLLGGT